jgi:hypothetical protein
MKKKEAAKGADDKDVEVFKMFDMVSPRSL